MTIDLNEENIIQFPDIEEPVEAIPADVGDALHELALTLLQQAKSGEIDMEVTTEVDFGEEVIETKKVPMTIDQKLDIFKWVSNYYIGTKKLKAKKEDPVKPNETFSAIKDRINSAGKK